MAIKRVELPNFDGTDIVAWLARAEQYFAINNICEDTKGPIGVNMHGKTSFASDLLD